MSKLSDAEKKVLLILSELEPASLDALAANTGIELRLLKKILQGLVKKGWLEEPEADRTVRENRSQ
jgi:DNA-binding MarR family transcriptional regulator